MSFLLYNLVGIQSEREMFVYFDEWADESIGPHAIRWRQYKAHFYTEG